MLPTPEDRGRRNPRNSWLRLLLGEELGLREGRRLRTALKLSGLPHHKTLDEFDVAFQPDLDTQKSRDLDHRHPRPAARPLRRRRHQRPQLPAQEPRPRGSRHAIVTPAPANDTSGTSPTETRQPVFRHRCVAPHIKFDLH